MANITVVIIAGRLIIPESGNLKDGSLAWSAEVFRIFGYHPDEIEVSHEFYLN